MATVPHFRLPLQMGSGGTFQTLEQDSDEDILQGVLVVLSTPYGRQVEIPSYGLREQLFKDAVDNGEVGEAIAAWQPRANFRVDSSVDSLDDLVQHVRVGVDHA